MRHIRMVLSFATVIGAAPLLAQGEWGCADICEENWLQCCVGGSQTCCVFETWQCCFASSSSCGYQDC